uniref:Uncharacterized protein n=1 Tax=Amphiprion ocellaris TaxID=80972 RepID=A0A3Q1BI51_AMPOC
TSIFNGHILCCSDFCHKFFSSVGNDTITEQPWWIVLCLSPVVVTEAEGQHFSRNSHIGNLAWKTTCAAIGAGSTQPR